MVDGSTWWHTGELDGTASVVELTAGGYTWAILLNTSNGSPQFWQELKTLGWTWLTGTKSWPTHDLFAPVQNATRLQATALDATRSRFTWANGSGTHRLVLLKAGSPSTALPLDGTAYPVASLLADGTLVAANGPDSTALLTHLNPKHTYYARVVEYRQDATTGNQPVYMLDGNPTRKLPPAASARPSVQFAARPNPVLGGLGDPSTTDSRPDQSLPMRQLSPGRYFLRMRRAWRASVLHLVKL